MTVVPDPAPAYPSSTTPLGRFALARSGDVDDARATVANAFCRHQLAPLERHERFEAQFNGVALGAVGVYYLDYGSAVRIDPKELDDFYLVQIPLSGQARILGRGWEVESSPAVASVLQPESPVSMRWLTGNRQLLVHIDSAALHDRLRRRLGRTPRHPIRFDPAMRLSGNTERAWVRLVRTLVECVDLLGVESENLAVAELGNTVMNQLLLSQANNYSAELHAPAAAAALPRPVRRAADILAARVGEQIAIPDIADEVGVSVRALQAGFRTHLGTTPSEYLRALRLRHAHADLTAADPLTDTVSDIAVRWGFTHLGRFAATYRAEYGESPAVTLRR